MYINFVQQLFFESRIPSINRNFALFLFTLYSIKTHNIVVVNPHLAFVLDGYVQINYKWGLIIRIIIYRIVNAFNA
jgi:hypothetical protein